MLVQCTYHLKITVPRISEIIDRCFIFLFVYISCRFFLKFLKIFKFLNVLFIFYLFIIFTLIF